MKDNIEDVRDWAWGRGPHGHDHRQGHGEGQHEHPHGLRGGHGGHMGPMWRGRWHGHGPGGWQNPFEFGGEGPWGGRRERLERGLLRYVILDVLSDGPKHGYEIIKQLEERTQGRYAPSPGTLYPTLQYLEDLGLVRSDQEDARRVYHLTDAGKAELDERSATTKEFWSRFKDRAPHGPGRYELKFIEDALGDLARTVRMGMRTGAFSDAETMRKVRQALERFQNEVREIITQAAAAASDRPSQSEGEDSKGPDSGQGTVKF